MNKIRTMVALNQSGDLTISWTEDQDEEMIQFIDKKLEDGYVFFEVSRSSIFFNLISKSRKKYITSASQLNGRKVTFDSTGDSDIADLLNSTNGSPVISKTPKENQKLTLVKGLSTADEVSKTSTIMIKPIIGG